MRPSGAHVDEILSSYCQHLLFIQIKSHWGQDFPFRGDLESFANWEVYWKWRTLDVSCECYH